MLIIEPLVQANVMICLYDTKKSMLKTERIQTRAKGLFLHQNDFRKNTHTPLCVKIIYLHTNTN